ncbi:fluoride efflux transporter FluC [Pseudarthrobacter sp. S9]|uniref:fluoride efflux transporter FluC n=1 Tax=Pseudarthrobacter sp. S9 TaxID=3418421 RepID=UPI003CFCD72F
MTALLVGILGVAGALLRFAVDSWFAHHQGPHPHWPWATLTVNVTGSFIIGLSMGLSGHLELGADWHAGIATGLAGGLTTFSSWTTATVRLVSETRYRAAALNVAANLVAGLAAAGAGLVLAG